MYFQSAGLITAEDVVYLAAAVAVRTRKSASRGGSRLDLDPEFAMGEFGSLRFRTHEPDEPAGRFQRASVNLRNLHWRHDHGFIADYPGFGFYMPLEAVPAGPTGLVLTPFTSSSIMFRTCTAIMPSNSAETSVATLPTRLSLARRKARSISGEASCARKLYWRGVPTFRDDSIGEPGARAQPMGVCSFDSGRLARPSESDGQSRAAL